jgi:hypothetical protein
MDNATSTANRMYIIYKSTGTSHCSPEFTGNPRTGIPVAYSLLFLWRHSTALIKQAAELSTALVR